MTTTADIETIYWDWRAVWEANGYPANCLASLVYRVSADLKESSLIGIKFSKSSGADRVFDRFNDATVALSDLPKVPVDDDAS